MIYTPLFILDLLRPVSNSNESTRNWRCLAVFGLSLWVSQWTLEKEFSKFGPLEKVQIPRGRYFSEKVKTMPRGRLEIQKLCPSKSL